MKVYQIILKVLGLGSMTLFGKITLSLKILYKGYKLLLIYKYSKMTDIDKLKELLKATIKLTVEVVKDAKDGKITLAEIVGLIPETLAVVKQIPNFKEVVEEIKDFDTDDAKELIEFIENMKDISGTDANVILENVLEIYVKGVDIYEDNLKPIIDIVK